MATRVVACRCPACGDDIYSRATHDFRVCSCGAIFVDGGFEPYAPRYGFLVDRNPDWSDIYVHDFEVDANQDVLFDDYNIGTDRFGKITVEKRREDQVTPRRQ